MGEFWKSKTRFLKKKLMALKIEKVNKRDPDNIKKCYLISFGS